MSNFPRCLECNAEAPAHYGSCSKVTPEMRAAFADVERETTLRRQASELRKVPERRSDWRSSELAPPARTQEQTAAWMGYDGPDPVGQMNSHHDRLHERLAGLSGGYSHSLGVARDATTSEQDHAFAAYEEDAVLHLQRYLVRSGRMDQFLGDTT